MKAMKTKFIYLVFFLTTVCFLGCDDYEDESSDLNAVQEQLDRLVGQWNGDQVLFEGIDVTLQDFQGFTLTFSEDRTWSSENGAPTFGTGGTWDFDGAELDRLIMNDIPVNLTFTYDGRQLTMNFVLTGSSIGRKQGTTGDYVIYLSPLD